MAFDMELAGRIRTVLRGTPGLHERRMFGGLAFLVNGHIVASAYQDGRLLVTCSQDDYGRFTTEPGAGPMLRKGRPVSGWVLVDAEVVADDDALGRWVSRGLKHSRSRPPQA